MMVKMKVLFVLGIVALLIATISPLLAQNEAPAAAPVGQARLRHCITQVEVATAETTEVGEASSTAADVSGDEALLAASAPAATCFATFAEAVSAATNGAVQLAPDVTAATLTEEMLQSEAPTAVIIGIDYDNFNSQGGASLTFFANNAVGCTTGLSYSKGAAPAGWDNRTSSAAGGFVGCNHFYHYEGRRFTGAVLRCPAPGNTCAVFGAMNNHTSSWRWYGGGFHY